VRLDDEQVHTYAWIFMKMQSWRTLVAVLCVSGSVSAARAEEPALFRVFLKDGPALVSYGEVARVGQTAIFSMPSAHAVSGAKLHLVNIPADRVDWERTSRYAEVVRAAHYLKYQAAFDYIALSNEVARTLETVALATDPAVRLSIVEAARRKLADWPKTHYNFKEAEVKQMLVFLDNAIADLRSVTGTQRFDLSFTAASADAASAAAPMSLLPPPTLKEAIELTLVAARQTDVSAERAALLSAALADLNAHADELPREWAAATVASTQAAITRERRTDALYQNLSEATLTTATRRARAADVRGLERLLDDVRTKDEALGAARPDVVNGLVGVVREQLAAARMLRLERDRWALRVPLLRDYRQAIDASLVRFGALKPWLEDIKSLAGSSPSTLRAITTTADRIRQSLEQLAAPEEVASAHALLASAVNLAASAAGMRRDAVMESSISKAWEASAAAAGALLLGTRAHTEIDAMLRVPQLPQ
jgi:hypothetical protein